MEEVKKQGMESLFVPYKIALALKKLGFDEPCFATWSGETLDMSLQIPSDDYFTKAPTFSQAFRFFREKYGLSGIPKHNSFEIWDSKTEECLIEIYPINSYEEAELACLRKLIEIVKNKN